MSVARKTIIVLRTTVAARYGESTEEISQMCVNKHGRSQLALLCRVAGGRTAATFASFAQQVGVADDTLSRQHCDCGVNSLKACSDDSLPEWRGLRSVHFWRWIGRLSRWIWRLCTQWAGEEPTLEFERVFFSAAGSGYSGKAYGGGLRASPNESAGLLFQCSRERRWLAVAATGVCWRLRSLRARDG
jgi:hypothetical protein